MERLIMSLLLECLESTGQLIYCRPSLEVGWLRLDATGVMPSAGSHSESPAPFRFRVLRFFSSSGKFCGVLGQIEESAHPFDSLFVVAGIGSGGPFGFQRQLSTRWDIEVGEGPIWEGGWPRIELISQVHTGFGVVGSCRAVVDESLGLVEPDSRTPDMGGLENVRFFPSVMVADGKRQVQFGTGKADA